MAIIGFVLCMILGVCLGVGAPVVIIVLSMFDGGLKKREWIIPIIMGTIGFTIMYFTIANAPFTVALQ